MPWYAWLCLLALATLAGYQAISITSLQMQLDALRVDYNALLKKLTGHTDGATLSEALDKGPNSITALQEFLNEKGAADV